MHFFWRYKLDHVLFWAFTIVFYASVTDTVRHKAGLYQYGLNIFIRNGLLMLICYLNMNTFFPRFFKKNNYLLYALSALGCLLLYTALKNVHDVWLYGYAMGDSSKQDVFANTFYNVSVAFFYLSFTTALMLSKHWYQQQQLLQKIQVENLQTELQYLKAQMNPHFLFNSINTIYFQIDKSNAEARESLQKFSDLLRYQLYECNEEEIAIEKEIDYLRSYIGLQQLRRQSHYHIRFEVSEEVQRFSIAPLLLISFVENACKHVSCHADKDNTIDIRLHRQNGHVLFTVINTKEDKGKLPADKSIGLKNVKRRLELLYADKHSLIISNEPSLYSVHLKLPV